MAFGFIPQLDLELDKYLQDQSETDVVYSKPSRGFHRTRNMSSQAVIDAVPQVDIDSEGRFKYILLKLWAADHKDEEDFKYLVRGYNRADWHSDIYEEVYAGVRPLGLDVECVGGGRILHEPEKKKIFIYGYSQGFGKADHSITCDLLKKKYPHYDSIEWKDEGY